jgi:hypothetical protein
MQIVPALSTPIDAAHARDALLAAAPALDRASASLLLALIWVETGGGHLFNWNAGNISAGSSWPGNAWRPPWFELTGNAHLDALHERMLKGEAPSAFRAYNSAPEGFADFVGTLRRQFQSVLAAAGSGDAATFVHALHDSGYSRDYTPAHVGTFAHLQAQFAPLVSHLPAGAGAGVVVGFAAVGLALVLLLRHSRKGRRRWQRTRS